MLSHARLRGGSNDATDTRGVEYALLQILRCGIIKSSKSANIAGNVDCIRSAEPHTQDHRHTVETEATLEDLILPIEVKIKIQNLGRNNITPANTWYIQHLYNPSNSMFIPVGALPPSLAIVSVVRSLRPLIMRIRHLYLNQHISNRVSWSNF
jgi:hypothetical protein